MRKILLLAAVIYSLNAIAQGPYCTLPATYYNGLTGLSCNQLKAALFTKISTGYTAQTYNSAWANFEKTDKRRNDANTADIVWDTYTDKPAATGECEFSFSTDQDNGSQPGNAECQAFNREHSMPKSWFGGDVSPMYTDLFELYPTDKYLNNEHGNLPFGEVNPGAPGLKNYANGTRLGASAIAGISGTVFEPIDAYKGDFARSYLYMVTRYHDVVASWDKLDPSGDKAFDGKQFPAFALPYLQMLLNWHHNDPVSQKEINRNNAIYCFQHNRNPFIDHPEYVDMIWSPSCLDQALPVDIVTFKGLLEGNAVNLSWEIANERNLRSYVVERSVNSEDFSAAGEVLAIGRTQYSFKDDVSNLTGRRLYYRLKQVDKNGSVKYSQVFTVHVPLNTLFRVYPNPAHNTMSLQFYNAISNARMVVVDMAGRIQLQQTITQASGIVSYNISQLAPGSYVVKITADGQQHQARLEVIR